jgi:hypothetical protein
MVTELENNFERESKEEDLKFLIAKLEEIHPDPYRNINQEKDVFTNTLEKSLKVPEEFFPLAIQESLALLKDGHTGVKDYAREILPIKFLEFENSYYIIAAEEKDKDQIGNSVLAINGFTIERINKKIAELSSKENNETLLYDLQNFLRTNNILRYYKFSNSKDLVITTNKGDFKTEGLEYKTKLVENKPLKNWGEDTYEGNTKYRFKTLNETLLFQYNTCNNRGHSEKELTEFKEKLLNKSQEVKNIIVDLRLNNGGDTEIMRDLFEKLPENKKIYVASSRETFSSAMHHLIYLKRKKHAVLIGENSRQKANRFGFGENIELPNSKINISCSKRYFELYPEKDLEIIEPDIRIPVTIEDYINNTDPLNKWIKENLED